MGNVNILYRCWWQRVAGVSCAIANLSRPPLPTDKGLDDKDASETEQSTDPSFFVRPTILLVGKIVIV